MKPSRRKFLAVTGSATVASVAGVGSASAATISDVPIPDTGMMYPTMGTDVDNPTATVYGNYKCPFTNAFVNDSFQSVVENYVKTGKLNVRFRTISYDPHGRGTTHGTSSGFISGYDPEISAVGLCVWEEDPNSYWDFFETMFQPGNVVSGSVENVKPRLKQAGVSNADEVYARAMGGKCDSLVKDSHGASVDLKLQGTPRLELGGDTLSGLSDASADKVVSWVESLLPKGATYEPAKDEDEVSSGGSSGSSSSSDSVNKITFDGSSAEGWADYELTVSGEFKQSSTMDSTLEDSDSVDGATASGGVGPWEDTFTYTGEITDLYVSQKIDVTRNGESLDLDEIGAVGKKLDVESSDVDSQSNAGSNMCLGQ